MIRMSFLSWPAMSHLLIVSRNTRDLDSFVAEILEAEAGSVGEVIEMDEEDMEIGLA